MSRTTDKSVAQIARELGIRVELLYRWRSESAKPEGEAFPGHGKRPALEAENAQLRREVARLEQEREILQNALGHLHEAGVSRMEFIHSQREQYPVCVLCRALQVSRSGYYAWRQRPPGQRA